MLEKLLLVMALLGFAHMTFLGLGKSIKLAFVLTEMTDATGGSESMRVDTVALHAPRLPAWSCARTWNSTRALFGAHPLKCCEVAVLWFFQFTHDPPSMR